MESQIPGNMCLWRKVNIKVRVGAFLFSNFERVTPGINLVNRISNLFFSKNRASLASQRATEGGGGEGQSY